tara:strand:+ start:161 stop:901 length:741 start_codon:yes stop_codon:yes gene_type:complete
MVNIDTVYQKVLLVANKEQRGYITPQEFNLLANKAQMEIFDGYFHDLKTAYHKVKNETSHSDEVDMILEKLQVFKKENTDAAFTVAANTTTLDLNVLVPKVYRLDIVSAYDTSDDNSVTNSREFTQLSKREIVQALRNPLTKPTTDRPVFIREGADILRVYPQFASDSNVIIHYWRKPINPYWMYVVVNQEALYNGAASKHFQLHPSEEENLVTRILELSGLVIKNQELSQSATIDKANTYKQQND